MCVCVCACVCVCVCVCVPNQGYRTQSVLILIWVRIVGFMPFYRAFVRSEMQLAFFRIWIGFTESISYDDTCYTLYIVYSHVCIYVYMCDYICDHLHTHIHTYAHTHVHTHTHAHTYTHTHTHAHTHIYIYIYVCLNEFSSILMITF